jgi:hypothetical protein
MNAWLHPENLSHCDQPLSGPGKPLGLEVDRDADGNLGARRVVHLDDVFTANWPSEGRTGPRR